MLIRCALSIIRAACAAAKIDKRFWSLEGIGNWAFVFDDWWVWDLIRIDRAQQKD